MLKIKHLPLIGLFLLSLPLTALADLRTFVHDEAAKLTVPFSDIGSAHPNYSAIAILHQDEVIKGYPDGTFQPDRGVNRAEMMKMLVLSYISNPPGALDTIISGNEIVPLDPVLLNDPKYANCFSDVKDEWFAPYVCYAKEQGWIEGYPDGSYKPAQNVNRVEAIKMTLNTLILDSEWPSPTEAEKAFPMPADADMNQWYAPYLHFGIAKELLDGNHVTIDNDNKYYYGPAENMSRKEVAETIFRTSLYMLERSYYAELFATMQCFRKEHTDLGDEGAYQAWLEELDRLNAASTNGLTVTQEEIDELYLRYGEDDVVTQAVHVYANDICEGVEY